MKHLLLTKKIMVLAMLSLALSTEVRAADTFVVFEPTSGAWQLSDLTIGIAEDEHSCVKLAAANLAADFESVTGKKPLTTHLSPLTSNISRHFSTGMPLFLSGVSL